MHLNGAPMQQKLINAKPVDQFLRNFENTLQMQTVGCNVRSHKLERNDCTDTKGMIKLHCSNSGKIEFAAEYLSTCGHKGEQTEFPWRPSNTT